MQQLVGSGTPVLYIEDARFLKGNKTQKQTNLFQMSCPLVLRHKKIIIDRNQPSQSRSEFKTCVEDNHQNLSS
jgi:hypothetical protein